MTDRKEQIYFITQIILDFLILWPIRTVKIWQLVWKAEKENPHNSHKVTLIIQEHNFVHCIKIHFLVKYHLNIAIQRDFFPPSDSISIWKMPCVSKVEVNPDKTGDNPR